MRSINLQSIHYFIFSIHIIYKNLSKQFYYIFYNIKNKTIVHCNQY